MRLKLSYHWLIGAFIALFFALQSYGLAHAASHGDEHHEHDGIACAVTVLADNQVVILPAPPVFETVDVDVSKTVYPDFTSALYLKPQCRAPPPRAPPSHI